MIRALYDDLGAIAKWWAIATGMFMVVYADALGDRGSQDPREHAFETLVFTTIFTMLLVIPGILAFSRQGRLARFATKVVGAAGPLVLMYALGTAAAESGPANHPVWTMLVVAFALAVAWLYVGHLGRRSLQVALAGAASLRAWSAPAKVDTDHSNALLQRGTSLAGLDSLAGTMRVGTLGELPAVAFTGSGVITAVPETVDWRSRIGLALNVFLTKGRQTDPEDFTDSTRVFVTTLVVDLPTGGAITSFDLRSRDWRDGDVVYTNVDDRTERFESIELDEHHEVRVPNTAGQLEVWAAITPDVVVHLAGMRRLDLSRRGDLLVATRVGGCGSAQELDRLVESVAWFATDLIPGGRRSANLQRTPEPTA